MSIKKDVKTIKKKVNTIKKNVKAGRKGELQKDAENVANKVGAGAKAMYNKLDSSYSDLKAEYQKERSKRKTD